MEFLKFDSIPRLFRPITITEKIDGTNAAVVVTEEGVFAQSRKQLITPENDNFGFAAWVQENEDLLVLLGPGYHYGEWWGYGIQCGYGLAKGERRFSLFNTARWAEADLPAIYELDVVPVLYEGAMDTAVIEMIANDLELGGSVAAPGFARPEGIVIYHSGMESYFKYTPFVKNDGHKSIGH